MRPIEELVSFLPDIEREAIEDGGYDASEISNAIQEYINGLYDELAVNDVRAHKEIGRLEEANARMLPVLTKVSKMVMNFYEPDENLDYKYQGSNRGDFEWGQYSGRTDLANDLALILLEKDDG